MSFSIHKKPGLKKKQENSERTHCYMQQAKKKNPASNEINIVTSNLKINKMNPGKLICWRHDEDTATLPRCFRHKVR